MSEFPKSCRDAAVDRIDRSVQRQTFVFVSGRISPVYIDCESCSHLRRSVNTSSSAGQKSRNRYRPRQHRRVAGGEPPGFPTRLSFALDQKPMIYIRKQPKGYGGTKQIEGILEPRKRVMLVEDLITDGLSKLRFNIGIRGAGAKMTHCLCVFDYASDRLNQHEGKINLAKNDIALHVLANWDDVLDAGLAKNYFTAEQDKQIIDFLQDAENWGRTMGFV